MKDLIVLCGTSHSGKSDYARQYEVTHTIISSDEIRAELGVKYGEAEDKVWQIFAARKFEAMLRLDNIILDACHISKRARSHSLQGPNAHHRKICVAFDLPLRTIRERCCKEERVCLKEVERMWKDFQDNKPTAEQLKREGFDEVYFIRKRPVRIIRFDAWSQSNDKYA